MADDPNAGSSGDRSDSLTPTETREGPAAAPLPKQIGQFHVKGILASGGMGIIYKAVQEHPRRTVAVKVMRQGIASRSAMRRFEYESQILARLRHPGIAQIYEAGTHQDGTHAVPYFAMEYIPNAKSVIQYANEKNLTARQRLELFTHVCDAVHHGHQKGIIHRDLKPGNILVDPQGDVKIIDFGVARGTDSDLAVTTLQTDLGQLIGTLQYMSPEQCQGDPEDIDTRSDVYALGVVLYELVARRLPYSVSSKRVLDGTRIIREQQPTRFTAIDRSLTADIETIVLKAMEKERDRRYRSAAELGDDIKRFLHGEAITARPPSIVYQLRLFARRHKALFSASAVVFVVLAVGVIASTSLYLRAESARVEAQEQAQKAQAATRKEHTARQEAEKQSEKAEAAVEFLQKMLHTADPSRVGREVKLVTLLNRFAPAVSVVFAKQPDVEAEMHTTIGLTYQELMQFDQAEEHLAPALDIRRRIFGGEHPETLTSMHNLADLAEEQGRLEQAEAMFAQVHAIRRRVLGEEHPDTLKSLEDVAWFRPHEGKLEEAGRLKKQILEVRRRVLGDSQKDTQKAVGSLANLYLVQGQSAQAAQLYNGKRLPENLGIEEWFQGQRGFKDRGHLILLFWESWCPYCERHVPRLQGLYEKFQDRGLEVVGLIGGAGGSTPEKVRDFIVDKELTYPIGKEDGSAFKYFGATGVPHAAAIKNGQVVWQGHPGHISEPMIDGLLRD